MIYVTGDTHGEFNRFSSKNFHAGAEDIVIVCGDFGFLWDNSREEKYWQKWLCQKPYKILFCDGNHDNYDMLKDYPIGELFKGKVQKIAENIYHLMRGEMYEIEGKKFFVMGGAMSHDTQDGILDPSDKNFSIREKALHRRGKKRYRVKGISWWAEEMPDQEEYSHAEETLFRYDYKCDYIITHDCPSQIQQILKEHYLDKDKKDEYSCNELNEFHQKVADKCKFRKWFFGHYHMDVVVSDKFRLLNKDIVTLNGEKIFSKNI